MNLEALVSKLDSSKNREFAKLYFEQMAILEEAREKYITFKEQYKVSCDVEVAKLITKRETCIAQNIGINKDYKELVRNLKLQAKEDIKILKSDYKIESKQIKSELVRRLPVITSGDVPKDKVKEIVRYLDNIEVSAPIKVKDVVVKDVMGLGVDILATRSVEK